METTECDIIFIDETKLHEYSAIPNFEGYTPIHEERKKKTKQKGKKREGEGGGIAAYIKNDLHKICSQKIKINNNEDLMAFKIETKDKPIHIIQGYAPQETSIDEAKKFFSDLDEYIRELNPESDIYIIGDLNAQMSISNKKKGSTKQKVNQENS